MIIHFWNLPENRNYIKLKKEFTKTIVNRLPSNKCRWRIRNSILNGKISIEKIKKISKEEEISLEELEENIFWTGGNNSKGLSNPKFPINFSSRQGTRFIAAIINDGTLTKNNLHSYGRLMYDNFDSSLRESVIKDYLEIFGGKKEEVAFRNTDKKKYLEFSSVIRDIVELVIENKGPKAESNIKIPSFIFNKKENMLGWIEQTIADEGEVKHCPTKNYSDKYRRAIIWRRSLDVTNIFNKQIKETSGLRKLPLKLQSLIQNQRCNLIEKERKMLKVLGIKYKIYNLGIYPTTKNKIRTRWQISITKRENLVKLRKLIKIPSKEKEEKFTKLTKEFVRYKEPLKIKKVIIDLGKNGNTFTSIDLKAKMKYKETNTAIKWLKIFEKQNLIRKIKESTYGNKKYRQPALYKLILDK